jgi:hypothetical protein
MGQGPAGEIRPEAALSQLAMTPTAPPVFPSSLTGVGGSSQAFEGLSQRRKDQSENDDPHEYSSLIERFPTVGKSNLSRLQHFTAELRSESLQKPILQPNALRAKSVEGRWDQ